MNTLPRFYRLGLLGYFGAVNAGSAAIFWYDKQQAIKHQWRVRESTLQLTALFGGWIGGFWAMQMFKHKRSKPPFLKWYYAAVGGNVALIGTGIYLLRYRPQLLRNLLPGLTQKYQKPQQPPQNFPNQTQTYTTEKPNVTNDSENNYNNRRRKNKK
eukprot:TRINITY_DN6151_c0_g1_i1.p1 TRINITY_DN6151_c0_g1~~TRINITY_DN6151_c0_g1_i1.p1  ORF type:complete len:156 (-),score=33.76 TRINITY_DN6151_c0_g1_i1:207-674(-)